MGSQIGGDHYYMVYYYTFLEIHEIHLLLPGLPMGKQADEMGNGRGWVYLTNQDILGTGRKPDKCGKFQKKWGKERSGFKLQ